VITLWGDEGRILCRCGERWFRVLERRCTATLKVFRCTGCRRKHRYWFNGSLLSDIR
jgi:hypothetical protein